MKFWTFLVVVTFTLFTCKTENPKQENKAISDILFLNQDTTIKPGEDIFAYINGSWLKQNPIPAEEVSWGIGNLVIEENYQKLKKICESSATANAEVGSNTQKIGDYWKLAMDSTLCNTNGITPLLPWLHKIDSVSTIDNLILTVAQLSEINACSLFSSYVTQDDKNSEKMSLYFYQGGIGLPNRDYYFNTDERTKKIRDAYPNHIRTMLEFVKYDSTTAKKICFRSI